MQAPPKHEHNWIEKQAIDNFVTRIQQQADRAYISAPSKVREILKALGCAETELKKLMFLVPRDLCCPWPYCLDPDGGCVPCEPDDERPVGQDDCDE